MSNPPDSQPNRQDLLESRPRHRYIFCRPRVLQYTYKSEIIQNQEEDSSPADLDIPRHVGDETDKQRERLDLFVDLIWVGIISNISEVFSSEAFDPKESRPARAFLFFVVVFLPSWRIWNGIREILNNYYMDDISQRVYILLLLVLSVFFGNNLAYVVEIPEQAKIFSISLYLFIRSSLILIEAIYSVFIPWLRRLVLLTVLLYLPSIGLWVGGLYLEGPRAFGPIFAAIFLDYTVPIILDSELASKAMPSGYGKALDAHHFTSRMGNFFIITLGEGVLQLVKDGPLGPGVTRTAGLAVWTLAIYFVLAYLYFNRDLSRTFIPAVQKKGWKTLIWLTFHIPIFMATLTLSAAVMFIIRQSAALFDAQDAAVGEQTTESGDGSDTAEMDRLIRTAIWTIAISLATIISFMTAMALLDEPHDAPNLLRVNNRYLRLSGRIIYVVVVICIPIKRDISTELFLGICTFMLVACSIWEWVACTERSGKIVEPKKHEAGHGAVRA